MWRGFQVFLSALNVALICMGSYFLYHRGFSVAQGQQVIDYKDFVSILLTALAVMMAVVTIFVAAAAFWGFSAIKDEATKAAKQVATEVATKVATTVAEEVATTVAIRTARGTEPSETSPKEAEKIAEAMGEDQNGI